MAAVPVSTEMQSEVPPAELLPEVSTGDGTEEPPMLKKQLWGSPAAVPASQSAKAPEPTMMPAEGMAPGLQLAMWELKVTSKSPKPERRLEALLTDAWEPLGVTEPLVQSAWGASMPREPEGATTRVLLGWQGAPGAKAPLLEQMLR